MTTRRKRILHRCAAVLLLPLSVVPFVAIGPQLVESHHLFTREQNAWALPAPQVVLSPAELAHFKQLPAFGGAAVPVLAYGGLAARARQGGGAPELTQRAFARQMEMLARLGFHTISIHRFSRFRRGLPAGMPPRPLLITFDGGRLDSFRAADRVLQRHGFRATIFVNGGEVQRRGDDYLTWRELRRMRDSGRWDVQAGSQRADARVAVDSAGHMQPAYAYRRWTRSNGEETFADWQQRVTHDVFDARASLVAHGFDPAAFAVPGGADGQAGSNDARIAPFLRGLLAAQFGQALTEGDDPAYAGRTGEPQRLVVRASTTAWDLYNWLARHDPGTA